MLPKLCDNMATDFFQRQDHARRQTTRLLVMFAFSVAAIILAIYLVVVLGAAGVQQDRYGAHVHPAAQPNLWNPRALRLGHAGHARWSSASAASTRSPSFRPAASRSP